MRYTREIIIALKPGRELDALVAEEVMGYAIGDGQGGYVVQKVIILRPDDGSAEWLGDGQKQLPRYSTDISVAFEMENHLEQIGLVDEYGFQVYAITEADETRAGIRNTNMFKIVHASPEQRCKAALLAVLE